MAREAAGHTLQPTALVHEAWMQIARPGDRRWNNRARFFTLLEIDEAVAWQASRVRRHLRQLGKPIGDNDVWIAATALCYGLPVVTNNITHFGRVPGLKIMGY